MEAKKKRLTLDIDPAFQRRLKVMAALKGVSMRGYCQAAIDRELTRDEANGAGKSHDDRPDHVRFAEARQKYFGDRVLPGNSADYIREAREERDAQTETWVRGTGKSLDDRPAYVRFAELQQKHLGDSVLPGNAADDIREAREIRDAETENSA